MKFKELELLPELLKSIKRAGLEEATPTQAETIPLALAGKGVIGQAQTGTGKTAAFGLPMLEKIDPDRHELQGLVITPTRGLAIQTQEGLYRLGHDKKVRVQAIYGGADIGCQIHDLKDRPHIAVGTPGRMLDHTNRHTLKLGTVRTLALGGAGEMLNMGLLEDIEKIISQVPDQRRTLLFSATMPPAIKDIGIKFMKSPHHVKIGAKEMTADLTDQCYVRAKKYEKFDIMTHLSDVQTPELTIIFGHTRHRVGELARGLETRGYRTEGIHGNLSQQKRMNVLRSFKNGHLDIPIATDVAARGLDISGVIHVYNYNILQDPESYVHRIGYAGRAGKDGMPVAFVTPNEMDYLHIIKNLTRKRVTTLRPSTEKEAFRGQLGATVEQVKTKLVESGLDKYLQTADKLLEEHSAQDLVTLLLKATVKDLANAVSVKITPEHPLPMQKKGYNRNGERGGGNNCNHRDGRNYRRNKSKGGYSKDNNSQKDGDKHHNDKKRGFVIRPNND